MPLAPETMTREDVKAANLEAWAKTRAKNAATLDLFLARLKEAGLYPLVAPPMIENGTERVVFEFDGFRVIVRARTEGRSYGMGFSLRTLLPWLDATVESGINPNRAWATDKPIKLMEKNYPKLLARLAEVQAYHQTKNRLKGACTRMVHSLGKHSDHLHGLAVSFAPNEAIIGANYAVVDETHRKVRFEVDTHFRSQGSTPQITDSTPYRRIVLEGVYNEAQHLFELEHTQDIYKIPRKLMLRASEPS